MPPLTALTGSLPGYAETYGEVSKSNSNKEHMQMSKNKNGVKYHTPLRK